MTQQQREAITGMLRASPFDPAGDLVYGSLAGLPPLLTRAGSHEILLDDAVRLAARAAYDDVSVTLDVVRATRSCCSPRRGKRGLPRRAG